MRGTRWIPLVAIILILSIVSLSLSFSSSPLSWDDGLRHITMARVMRSEGILQTWDRFLYGGTLSHMKLDPWFLADVAYIPFIYFPDALALRLFSIVGIAVLLGALWRIISPLKLPRSWEAVLLLLTIIAPGFYGRMLLGRPFVWSSVFVLLVLDACLRRHYFQLCFVLFLATLTSQLFVLPLIVALGMSVWFLLSSQNRVAFSISFSSILSVGLGILIHPQSRAYAMYILTVFFKIPFVTTAIRLGTEMYPGAFDATVPIALIGACILLLFGSKHAGHTINSETISRHGTIPLAVLVGVLFVLTCTAWSRMIDLLWPLEVVLLAHVFAIAKPYVEDLCSTSLRPHLPLTGGKVITALLCLSFLMFVFQSAGSALADDEERSLSRLEPLSRIPAGSKVLNPEWFLFPAFVAVNPHVRYATGIDNTFLWKEDPVAYSLLDVLFEPAGQFERPIIDTAEWISQLLEHFPGSEYFIVSRNYGKHLLPALRTTPGLRALTQSGDHLEVFAIDEEVFAR